MNRFLDRIAPFWQKATWILWLALVAALPVTSFPFFARILHTSAVAPASGMFLILLAVLWLPVFIYQKGRVPFQSKPLLLFILTAFLSIGLSFFRELPDFKNQSLLMAAIEGSATLVLGALFYLITASLPDSSEKIQKTLAVLNWSGLVLILWSLLQIIVSFLLNDFTDWMRLVQHVFSTTVLFDGRTTGFASEPSWLAHQFNLVYLPYWIAASIRKYSVHKFRVWKFSFENILFAGGVATLSATFSRAGLAAFVLVLALLFILANIQFVKYLLKKWQIRNRVLFSLCAAVFMLIVYLGIIIFGLFLFSKLDPRMEAVFQISKSTENPIMKYAENLQFGERVVYWQTGWNIFNDHPLIGVGVGFSGFYFPDYLPDSAWKLTEVRDLLYRSSGMLNIKCIWSRILAETGIIGFSLFMVFLVVSGVTAKTLISSSTPLQKTVGWMGVLMLIAFIVEGFSVDSFALPYCWFTLGLIAATWRWSNTKRSDETNG